MRPKWHFVLTALLALVGGIILLALLLYIVSFIVFLLRQSGAWAAPTFGWRGLYAFLSFLPGALLLLALVFVVVLELLVRRYAFAYRRPLLWSLGGIVLFALFGGLIVARTSLHARLSQYANTRRAPPFARGFYHRFEHRRVHNIERGQITVLMPPQFMMHTVEGEQITVMTTPRTRLPSDVALFVGEDVVVFGERHDSLMEALGVRQSP